jgi:signal transduction histidine kinase
MFMEAEYSNEYTKEPMSAANQAITATTMTGTLVPSSSLDVRMIAVMRGILAFSALLVVYVDPTRPAAFSALAYSSLLVYGMWSVVLFIMAFRRDPAASPPRNTHWGDVLFCAYLVTLTQGSNSLFASFFLFAILSASFSSGFRQGLLVTGASVILFILSSLWFDPAATFRFDQTLLRPIFLLTLGYMISCWGGHEITQRRRMRLLQAVNSQTDPRFGYDHAIRVNLERILDFFEASTCILVVKRQTSPPVYLSYSVARQRREQAGSIQRMASSRDSNNSTPLDEDTAKQLLSLPPAFSVCYEQHPAWWGRYMPRACATQPDSALSGQCAALARLLDTRNFLSLPYIQQDGTAGRVFIIPQKQAFSHADVEFIAQLLTAIARVVENLQLMDDLVAESAKHERFTISLDIHDTTIQPYIGLKLGLDALHRQAGADNPLSKEIRELQYMTESTIRDLRQYVTTLREDRVLAGDSLVKSIGEQAERYKRFYEIDVQVKCDTEIRVNSCLAGAALQIVSEGLSNILRHTHARRANISLRCENQQLQLEITNETPDVNTHPASFIPRSINARAVSLGGTCLVKCDSQGYTAVNISIPY